MKAVMLYVLVFPLIILVSRPGRRSAPTESVRSTTPAPHGLSEILYAYTSATANNGSAFAGLNTNTHFWNTTMGLAMLGGRFLMMVPVLAIAGFMAKKRIAPAGPGTFPTDGPLFTGLLISVVLIVGALTFFPLSASAPWSSISWRAREVVLMKSHSKAPSLFDRAIIRQAVWDSLRKLSPAAVAHNPVMFVVEVGSVLTTLTVVRDLIARPAGAAPLWFTAWISVWLWITVVFANFAEAVAEGRGRRRPIHYARCARRLRPDAA